MTTTITARPTRWLAVLFAAAVAFGCSTDTDDEGTGGPPPGGGEEVEVTVETVEVERGEFRVTGDYTGEIRSDQTTELSPEVRGRLESVRADVGDQVQQGEVLAEIDDTKLRQDVRRLQASLAVGRANLEEARVQHENLESDLRRHRSLQQREMVSARDVEELQNSVRAAEQQVAVAEARLEETSAQLENARQDLRNTELIAPFDGEIGVRHVARGSQVGPEQPVFTLVDGDELYLSVNVPEREAANIDTDTPATVRIPALGDLESTGQIHRIAPMVDSATRSLRVDVLVDDADELQLLPGMYARTSLQLGHEEDALTVDNQALLTTADGTPYVWAVDENDSAERIEFSALGLQDRERTQILEGLHEGDRIVLRGHEQLQEGSTIRDVDATGTDEEPSPPGTPEQP